MSHIQNFICISLQKFPDKFRESEKIKAVPEKEKKKVEKENDKKERKKVYQNYFKYNVKPFFLATQIAIDLANEAFKTCAPNWLLWHRRRGCMYCGSLLEIFDQGTTVT